MHQGDEISYAAGSVVMTNRVISDTSNATIRASPPSEVATTQATSNNGKIGSDAGTAI